MKLLVFAHRLEIGGTQTNAIELAARLRDAHGFDIVFFATDGPASELLSKKELRYFAAPDARLHPSPRRIAALRALIRQEQPDMVHAWDWWQGLEAYFGAYLTSGTPLVISDMMMHLTRAMPRRVPTTFGFADQKRLAEEAGWVKTHLMLPPVDVETNQAGVVDGIGWRRAMGVDGDDVLLVSVSRLADHMKSEPLERSISAIQFLGPNSRVRLVIVGDGAARAKLEQKAQSVNRVLGRDAISFAGSMVDPRAAYDAADVILGMGGSALRGMAFGKPVVVLGDQAFARTFSDESASGFMRTGLYGCGDGKNGANVLLDCIRPLVQEPGLRARLGIIGRDFVVSNHGIEQVAKQFAEFCRSIDTSSIGSSSDLRDAARAAFFYLRERGFTVPSRDRELEKPRQEETKTGRSSAVRL